MIVRKCLNCGKEFKTYQSQINRGGGKFCSQSCTTTYRNLTDNPSWKEDVREKISINHADVSGENNPMYGKSKELCPAFIDGRSKFRGRKSRKIGLANLPHICSCCGESKLEKLHIHHKDGNHSNNELSNLIILCSTCHLTKAHNYTRDTLGKITGAVLTDIGGDLIWHYQNI